MHFHVLNLDPNHFTLQRRHFPPLGKQRHLPRTRLAFHNLDRAAPRRTLAVVDLPQIQHLALHYPTATHAYVLHHAPIAVLLTVLAAFLAAHKHEQIVGAVGLRIKEQSRHYTTIAQCSSPKNRSLQRQESTKIAKTHAELAKSGYKRHGVEKGDELRVAGVEQRAGAVMLSGANGKTVAWEPDRLAARAGGVEVYKSETMELRAGDRIRWTRNDAGLGLVNSETAEVTAVNDGRVTFRLEEGRTIDMNGGDPQLRHIDRAWASTVHAFQGRTVDTVIAALEANHPNLTNQKMLYVEISRARDRAELVTDDKAALREQLVALTGERIAALEAVGDEKTKAPEAGKVSGRLAEPDREMGPGTERTRGQEKVPEPKSVDRDLGL